ncbi:MAG: hypothetical protein VZR64_09140, partial [Eubacterium sp.]|nr:hypothetical protein [Eubacterium sp.]
MNKKVRNFIFILTGLIMVGLCAVLGEGGISQVNKNEIRTADAASVTEETVVDDISTEVSEQSTLGESLEQTPDEPATSTDAEETKVEDVSPEDKAIMDMIDRMTLEEKVAQLFIITPDALTDNTAVTMAGDMTKQAVDETPV